MFTFDSIPVGFGNGPALPRVHGGGDDGGGLVAIIDGFLEMLTRAVESGAGWNPVAGIMALGTNLHPLIVHFPIAFLLAFLVLDILAAARRSPGLRQLASSLLYLGAVSAVAAAVAGLIAAGAVPHGQEVHEIMEWHERLGLTVATISVSLAVWRMFAKDWLTGMARALHLSLAGIVAVCLFLGADLGGLMVYQYGVGVKSLQQANSQHQHAGTHQHAHSRDVADADPTDIDAPSGTREASLP